MIIRSVEIWGTSDRGGFEGKLDFDNGLQIVSARNRFGKSTVFAGIVWCLGVEQIFGAQVLDNGIFPDAVRNKIDFGNTRDVPVKESRARLVLEKSNKDLLVLERQIVGNGADLRRIHFKAGLQEGDLLVGSGSYKDATSGFQAWFRRWADLPERKLANADGSGTNPIYLENIAPLFLIEQLRGWFDIQSEQVLRYGTREVMAGAFEYLLGLDAEIEERLRRQQAAAAERELRREATDIAAQLDQFLVKEGWQGFSLFTRGSLAAIAERWANVNLEALVEERFRFRYETEHARLQRKAQQLRARLNEPPDKTEPVRAVSDASRGLTDLKVRRHELMERTATLSIQVREQRGLLSSVDARLRAAEDLVNFRKKGVGILVATNCPTCSQKVSPETLNLEDRNEEAAERYARSVRQERELVKNSLERLTNDLTFVVAEASRIDENFLAAERTLAAVNEATGPRQEVLLQAASELMQTEREEDRCRGVQRVLKDTQARLVDWVRRVQMLTPHAEHEGELPSSLLSDFLGELKSNIRDLNCAGLGAKRVASVTLDDDYFPRSGKELVRAYGSASDRARLVLAYIVALLKIGRQHPGFAVLDEPVQQNPDPQHRALLVDFYEHLARQPSGQVIVFTKLEVDELARLRGAGATVRSRDNAHFLQPTK